MYAYNSQLSLKSQVEAKLYIKNLRLEEAWHKETNSQAYVLSFMR